MAHVTERTLLVGPGWLGATAAEHLAANGHAVWTLQRSAVAAPAGCVAVLGDISTAVNDAALRAMLPDAVDHVVVCVAPSSNRGDSYAIYPAAARGAVALAAVLGARSVVYVSSTGVYNRHDGSDVSESTPIVPTDARVQALYDAEQAVASAAGPERNAYVLRAAGLYGPGRDPARRFAAAAVSPETWCNFSWRDDVVGAIAHLLAQPVTGEARTFNCTDGYPVQAGRITLALTGVAPNATGEPSDGGRVSAGRSSQRIRIDALLATGWLPQVPTVFDGLQRLRHALPGLDEAMR